MPIRPVDRDALADACRSVAEEKFGFVYVDRDKDRIISEYESTDTSLVNVDTLSRSGLQDSLEEIAAEESMPFEQIRSDVFYHDPFGRGVDMGVAEELQALFQNRIVVTTEQIRQRFDLAHDDAKFFADELRSNGRNLVMRIAAGSRDYYTVGPKLKDHVGSNAQDLDDKLTQQSSRGTVSHEKLEDTISVTAVSDVIDYLQTEGYVIDLDGSYLVPAALDEFTRWLADEIESDVVDTFEDSGNVVPVSEYDSLLRTEIDRLSDVLSAVRSSRGDTDESDILGGVRDRLAESAQLEVDERHGVAVKADAVDADVESHAEKIARDVLGGGTTMSLSSAKESATSEVEELRLAATDTANGYLRDRITERVHEQIEEDF